MELHAAARRAATTIRDHPKVRWFLAADNDADGICAAGVMAVALRRAGRPFQFRASRQKDAEAYQALAGTICDGIILLDKGSSHVEALADVARRIDGPVILIDHHQVRGDVPDGVVMVNPRALGMDGSRDASAATTAAAVALAMDPRNIDLAGVALAGAVGDWQHDGGWQGWNLDLLQQAEAAGHMERRSRPALVGIDLADALTHTRPPTPAMDHEAAAAFLQCLDLAGVRDVDEIDEEARGRLLSAWLLHHLAHGNDVTPEDLTWPVWWDRRLDLGIRHLFRLMDACGRTGNAATGLAYLMGDSGALPAVQAFFDDYAGRLGDALARLRRDGTRRRQALQWTWTDDPAFTGMVGGIGMQHLLDPDAGPVVVLAKRPDGDVQVSTRATHAQVRAGLDLGRAVRLAARAVGRDGGGHPVASGAVIADADVEAFIDALDEALAGRAAP